MLELGRLPGVGERSAARLAYYIIKRSRDGSGPSLARDLAEALVEVDAKVRLCARCQNLCTEELCSLCRDARRDPKLLCVVEGVADLRAIDGAGTFAGGFYVLHGALSPLDGVGPEQLGLERLTARVQQEQVVEVILATNATLEGDATALYLAELMRPLGVTVSRLASGVPQGGELEYLDRATLGRALQERRAL